MKNVAGYDLGKLFCGSRGRLGRVEQLALRLHPAAGGVAHDRRPTQRDWRALHRSQLVPSAVDIAEGRMHVLFEGSQRAVDAQAARARRRRGGSVGRAARAAGARCRAACRWDGEPAPLVRPGPRVAYVEEAREPAWSPLAERVVEALCSPS